MNTQTERLTSKLQDLVVELAQQDNLNFLLTNRIPRRLVTQFMGWFAKREHPLVRDLSIATWRYFADLDLSDAQQQEFRSLHDLFIRQLREGARPIEPDPSLLSSPCDAIVGACGTVQDLTAVQIKGSTYPIADLLHDPQLVEHYRDGHYVTLRLTSSMYHRFHAPHDCTVERVTYFTGDTWNTNPITLQRVERLFCKNEHAVLKTRLDAGGHQLAIVPVAAILIASIRLHFLDITLHLRHRGPNTMHCEAHLQKGQEMGWFEHGSTIVLFAPRGFELCPGIETGDEIRMGQALLRLPSAD